MPLEFLISALVTLLVVVDPIGLVPSYLAVTHGLPKRARRSVALRAAVIAAAILVGSALIGDWLLPTVGAGDRRVDLQRKRSIKQAHDCGNNRAEKITDQSAGGTRSNR